jgi:predicted MFS family arabinose efflux permease
MDLSYFLGSLLLGAVAQSSSYSFMYLVSALFVVAMLGVYLVAVSHARE